MESKQKHMHAVKMPQLKLVEDIIEIRRFYLQIMFNDDLSLYKTFMS